MSNKWIRVFKALPHKAKHELGAAATLVLFALCDHASDDGYAWPSITTVSNMTGLSRRGTTKALGLLRASKRIERTDWHPDKPTRSTVYKLSADREHGSLLPFKKSRALIGNRVPPATGHSVPPPIGNSVPPHDGGQGVDKSASDCGKLPPGDGAIGNRVPPHREQGSPSIGNRVPPDREQGSPNPLSIPQLNPSLPLPPAPAREGDGKGEGETADALPPESKPESDDWGLGDGAPKPVGKLNPVREEARQLFMAVWGEGFNDDLDAIAYAGSVYALTAKVLHEGVPLGVMLGIGGDVRLDYREKRITTRGKVFTANWKAWCREHGFTKAKEPAKQATG